MSEDVNASLLLKLAQEGDIPAFEALIRSTEKLVYNLAYRLMGTEEDAKDISQEVFIKAYKNIARFDGKSAFATWIYRIAYNTCIDELRKRKAKQTVSMEEELEGEENKYQKQFIAQEENPEDILLKKESLERLKHAIASLSEEGKTVITLRDLEGFSYAEIADISGVSMGTVKSRLSRARKQLKDILAAWEEQTGVGIRYNIGKEGER